MPRIRFVMFREKFHLPLGQDGKPLIYLAGNSLGLMPKSARKIVEQELDDWAKLAVDAHLGAATPWYSYHETLREPAARLVGAKPNEVICMNSLTVNLHLMMATFYRPTKSRFKILMEEPAFPSDTYAIKTQIVHHGFDPKEALVLARPREGEFTVRQDDIEALLEKHGDEIALVLFAGVNFFTGQLFDIEKITAAAQTARLHGRDRSRARDRQRPAGDARLERRFRRLVLLQISQLRTRGGGGSVCARAARDQSRAAAPGRLVRERSRNTRFRMHLEPEFIPVPSADGWQISNPPIFSMAPLRASLAIFDEAGGMEALRAKSTQLTGYLQFLIENSAGAGKRYMVITPREKDERGCQLSILVHEHPKELFAKLEAASVKCDFREPNVIRAAPTPLYNTFHEVWRFARILAEHQ